MAIDTTPPVAPRVTLSGIWRVDPQVTLHTSLGDVLFELEPNSAPLTVANWLAYVNTGFYTDLLFHRVIPNFVVQGGGFTSGLNFQTPDYGNIVLESNVGLANLRGTLAMARTNAPNTANSQFFVNLGNNTSLNYVSPDSPGYAVYGAVVSGMDVIDAIAAVPTSTQQGALNVPVTDVLILGMQETRQGVVQNASGVVSLDGIELGSKWEYTLDGGVTWNLGAAVAASTSAALQLTGGGYEAINLAFRQTDAAGNVSSLSHTGSDLVVGAADSIIGDVGANTLTGTSGNDALFGLGGDDTLDAGAGDDALYGGSGSDTLIGGDGSDLYRVRDAGDLVQETNADAATGGVDAVFSDLASYTLTDHVEIGRIMGSGAAALTGNVLDNTLYAGTGNNTLDGGAGVDVASYLFGASGGVTVSLATNGAQATGGSGSDTLLNIENLGGSNFADQLTGDGNNNVIDGADGNDVLIGGDGSDTLVGGTGDDTLDGGAGVDSMEGGDGSDTYLVRDAGDVVLETSADKATGGTDTVSSFLAGYTLAANVENGRILAAGAADLTGNTLDNTLFASSDDNSLDGGAGVDTVSYLNGVTGIAGVTVNLALGTAQATGGSGSDTLANIENLTGSSNADTLSGDANANVIDGGVGDDVLGGGDGADTLIGGSGADLLAGGTGDDSLDGGTGNDALAGGTGNDALDGGTGTDAMDGGDGSDTYRVRDLGDTVSETNASLAIGGKDLVYSYLASYTLGANVEDGYIVSNAAATLAGNALANVLYAGDGDNVLTGGAGNDTVSWLFGAAGNTGVTVDLNVLTAQVTGGSGSDTLASIENLTGSAFADTLTGDGLANLLQGGDGADTLSGGGGADQLDGGTGADSLLGGAGDDSLDGGTGIDTMTGGDGSDSYVVRDAGDVVVETSTDKTTGGTDTVFSFLAGYHFTANVEVGRIMSSSAADMTANDVDNLLFAAAGDNVIDGGAGNDTVSYVSGVGGTTGVTVSLLLSTPQITGGSGSDRLISIENLTGSDYADTLTGDDTANQLDGGGGDDTLVGGGGDDRLTGGPGIDNLTGGSGADVLAGNGGNDSLDGGAGDDSLDGGSGVDTMGGGDGSDTYYVREAGDVVTESNANAVTGGVDLVYSFLASYTLGANVEQGYIVGVAAASLSGNLLANTFYAGVGDNVIDGGTGNDTVSWQFAVAGTTGVVFDLSVATAQATGGSGNDQLMSIENLTGSDYADMLTGDANDNVLEGGAGGDILTGGAGNDRIDGGSGVDTMTGGDGDDAYYVRDLLDVVNESNSNRTTGGVDLVFSYASSFTLGSNVENARIVTSSASNLTGNGLANDLFAGAGDNVITGGLGNDTVSYLYGVGGTTGVTMSLVTSALQVTGGSGNDTLVSIENLTGSAYADALTGNAGANVIDGGDGNDRMTGGNGDDAYYVRNSQDVVVETNATRVTGGSDVVYSFIAAYTLATNVETGIIAIDTTAKLTGNTLGNMLYAGRGNNLINGGGGSDTVNYLLGATAGVTVSLAKITAQATGGAGTDTLGSIENLIGSAYADALTGSTTDNSLDGGAGNDRMTGGDGNDTYYVREPGDVVVEASSAQAGTQDRVYSFVSSYTLATNVELGFVSLASAADLTGNAGKNILFAGAGNNRLDGGGDNDTVSYLLGTTANKGVTVSLAKTTAQATGGSGTDTLFHFENLVGSDFNDVLSGNSGSNVIVGLAGKDTMTGGGGHDRFDFSSLSDTGKTSSTCDVITDFRTGDALDLHGIDAIASSAADNAFSSTLVSKFTAAGQLQFVGGVLYGNTDSNPATAEFAIALHGVTKLVAGDFLL